MKLMDSYSHELPSTPATPCQDELLSLSQTVSAAITLVSEYVSPNIKREPNSEVPDNTEQVPDAETVPDRIPEQVPEGAEPDHEDPNHPSTTEQLSV